MKTIIIDIVLALLMLIIFIAAYAIGLPLLYKKRHHDTPWLPDVNTETPLTEENLGLITEDKGTERETVDL